MNLISIRGATTINNNVESEILLETRRLLEEIIEKNNIRIKDVISIIFTATKDIDRVYPAKAARDLGFRKCSLMCMQEMDVIDSLEMCIRVMFLANSHKEQEDVEHVYLAKAKVLRPDLMEDINE